MSILPNIAYAASNTDSTVNTIVAKIVENIVEPLIIFIFTLAMLVFIWGLMVFFFNGDDMAKRKQGQEHILWGIVGITIMVSVYGIIRLIANTVGQGSVLGF